MSKNVDFSYHMETSLQVLWFRNWEVQGSLWWKCSQIMNAPCERVPSLSWGLGKHGLEASCWVGHTSFPLEMLIYMCGKELHFKICDDAHKWAEGIYKSCRWFSKEYQICSCRFPYISSGSQILSRSFIYIYSRQTSVECLPRARNDSSV